VGRGQNIPPVQASSLHSPDEPGKLSHNGLP